MPKHFYEDVAVGETRSLGSTRVSKADIIAYASAFDPQPVHLDEDAARHTIVGRLCASDWHSCVILMRLLCDGFLLDAASQGSPGMEEIQFLNPVFPDDELNARYTCREKRVLASRPNVGLCRMFFEMRNGAGDVVLTWDTSQLLSLRPISQGERL